MNPMNDDRTLGLTRRELLRRLGSGVGVAAAAGRATDLWGRAASGASARRLEERVIGGA